MWTKSYGPIWPELPIDKMAQMNIIIVLSKTNKIVKRTVWLRSWITCSFIPNSIQIRWSVWVWEANTSWRFKEKQICHCPQIQFKHQNILAIHFQSWHKLKSNNTTIPSVSLASMGSGQIQKLSKFTPTSMCASRETEISKRKFTKREFFTYICSRSTDSSKEFCHRIECGKDQSPQQLHRQWRSNQALHWATKQEVLTQVLLGTQSTSKTMLSQLICWPSHTRNNVQSSHFLAARVGTKLYLYTDLQCSHTDLQVTQRKKESSSPEQWWPWDFPWFSTISQCKLMIPQNWSKKIKFWVLNIFEFGAITDEIWSSEVG